MSDQAQATGSTPAASPSANATPYGTLPNASPLPHRRPVSLPRLQELRDRGEKITMLTAYDATFAAVADAVFAEDGLAGVELTFSTQALYRGQE